MQTKTYFASSVPAALEVARQELGEAALLVSARPAPPDARQYGRLEVTFAWNAEDSPQSRSGPASQMDEIRRQLEALRQAVGGPAAANEDHWIAGKLIETGFSRQTAAEIAAAVGSKPGDPDAAVVEELIRRIPTVPAEAAGKNAEAGGTNPDESRMVAFVGPPGRGKTTSLVKLALHSGLARGVPVRIYTAGAHGIGAQEQMARYAAILGTPWHAYESLASLSLAFKGDAWKGLALIDTPGISPADSDELAEFGLFFAERPGIEKHLVLRSEASSADMLHMISRFSVLSPTRLLFTGLDEAVSAVPMLEALIRSGIPAAFAGTGQRVPDDLESVNPERLVRAVWSSGGAASTPNRGKFALAVA